MPEDWCKNVRTSHHRKQTFENYFIRNKSIISIKYFVSMCVNKFNSYNFILLIKLKQTQLKRMFWSIGGKLAYIFSTNKIVCQSYLRFVKRSNKLLTKF